MIVSVKNRLTCMGIKEDNQITTKLWKIKTFWSIYLQDNHCWKDLNHQKRGLIFIRWIKNESKCKSWLKKPQKRSPKWTKTQTRDRHPKGPFGTFGVFLHLKIQHTFSHSLTTPTPPPPFFWLFSSFLFPLTLKMF